jgi:hypothetical protein
MNVYAYHIHGPGMLCITQLNAYQSHLILLMAHVHPAPPYQGIPPPEYQSTRPTE